MKFSLYALLILTIAFLAGCKQDNSTNPGETSQNMTLLGKINFPSGYANGVSGEKINNVFCAFVAAGSSGLQVVNYNSLASLTIISSYNTSGESYDVTVKKINNTYYAFVSDYQGGFVIINANDPYHISLDTIITYNNDRVFTSFVDTTLKAAFVGTSSGRMYIYDLTNLPAVNQIAIYQTVSPIYGINVYDGLAYISEGITGLEIVDVTPPDVPAYVGSFNTPGISYNCAVNYKYAYIADGNAGITIIDITNPFNPVFVKSSATTKDCLGIYYTPSNIFTAESTNGCVSYTIGDLKNPTEYGFYRTQGYSTNIFYTGSLILLADGYNGLVILQ